MTQMPHSGLVNVLKGIFWNLWPTTATRKRADARFAITGKKNMISSRDQRVKVNNRRWMRAVVPANAGITGFSTMLPLYVLQLGGTVVEVALLATIYNFVLIPSSVFWGAMTDKLSRRRIFFFISYAGLFGTFVMMFFLNDLLVLGVLYGVLAFVIVANSAASNLLVMETTEKRSWVSSFASLSLTANLGSIVGLVVGLFWSSVFPLPVFLLFCAASTGASGVLTYFMINEPAVALETIHLTLHPLGLIPRLFHGVSNTLNNITGLVLSPPSPRDFVRLLRATRAGVMQGRALLFISTFLFMVGSALMNTSFTPYLVTFGVLNNEVFAVVLVNTIIQTGAYRSIQFFATKLGEIKMGSYAIVARTGIYLLTAISVLILRNSALFVFATIAYACIGIIFALWNSSTSVILFSNLGPEKQGGLLGAYSAFSSIGLVIGSLFSGYLSSYFGYSLTFTLAALVMLSSFFVLEASLKSLGIERNETQA